MRFSHFECQPKVDKFSWRSPATLLRAIFDHRRRKRRRVSSNGECPNIFQLDRLDGAG